MSLVLVSVRVVVHQHAAIIPTSWKRWNEGMHNYERALDARCFLTLFALAKSPPSSSGLIPERMWCCVVLSQTEPTDPSAVIVSRI